MASTETARFLSIPRPLRSLRWIEKYFYLGMSLLIAAVVVYGFSGTVDRKLIHAHPRVPILLWIHAIIFSTWVVFYILQSALVRTRRLRLHRNVGWAGAVLGTAMILVGPWVAVVMARFDINQLHRANRDAFLIIPLFDMAVFATCFGLAILWRSYPERHRRLLLIATSALTGAAFGRLSFMHAPVSFYGGIDVLIMLGVLRDVVINRRIHTVYLIAIPLLVAGQMAVAHIFLHRSAFWITMAHGLLG